MQQTSADVTKGAARVALPWIGGLTLLLTLTGLVPCCGLIVFPLGTFGIAYLVTPQLGLYAMPETKNGLALNIGIGIGLLAMAALVVATLVSQLLGIALVGVLGIAGGDPLGLAFGLSFSLLFVLFYVVAAIVGGALVGILAAFLGALVGLDRPQPAHYP